MLYNSCTSILIDIHFTVIVLVLYLSTGDIMCAERHAYQRLVRGPFKSTLTADEEKRIHGVPDAFKHAILTLPHQYAPR